MSKTPPVSKRIRASQPAIEKAIAAIQSSGLSVDRLLIEGGKVEVVVAPVDGGKVPENHGCFKPWS